MVKKEVTIGVLSYQGSVEEHLWMLHRLEGVRPVPVKTERQLNEIDGLILPGGESTTIAHLLRVFGMLEPLKRRIQQGMPVWGTCAGLILLAKDIQGEHPHLGVMDIVVKRNAYGRQIDSFEDTAVVPQVSPDPLPLVFIRAPWIERAEGNTQVLLQLKGHIVAALEDNMLVTSFHPELTQCTAFHRYFADLVRAHLE